LCPPAAGGRKGNFGTVLRIAKEIAEDASVEFAGALLRSHAGFLGENKEKTRNVLEATKQAGYQLVNEGRVSIETLENISQPLISDEERIRRYNYKQTA
jgi:hypothetical protein